MTIINNSLPQVIDSMDFPTPIDALEHWAKVQGDRTYMSQPQADGSAEKE